ncbi:ferric iron reductase FhuF-like transporter family protein [Vibrio astriarenae]|uniref:Ferric iron reductase FhuF-like transporter family protein n=1 Tax=Vibrio astriarenae TaxID=1481923 RepID=A0A7Z2YFM7_9VIBR|nr:(2Fe-2S)-binding protein [Vibrio astriarenae]QIA65359.1 ferric iron reductase FhuF-like transporter family protein [Vibrio astriarenae]
MTNEIHHLLSYLIQVPKDRVLTLKEQQELLNKYEPFFRLSVSNETSKEEHNAEQWFTENASTVFTQYAELLSTRIPFSTPIWQKVYNATLFTSLVAIRLMFNRVPNLFLADIRLSIGADHRISKLAISETMPYFALVKDSPNAIAVSSQQELDKKLIAVITQLSEPLLPVYKQHKVHARVYWGNIFYACNLAFSKLTNKPIEIAHDSIDTDSLDGWQSQLFDTELIKGGQLNQVKSVQYQGFQKVYVRRETCCMKYKIDGKAKCSTCNLIPDSEQKELMLNKLQQALQSNH